MKVSLKQIHGQWDEGWVLDKHMLRSTYLGEDAYGHPRFDSIRTEVGEATYQLKYQNDWTKVGPLAQALADNIYPKLSEVDFLVPMPATKDRARQPVVEIALALGRLVDKPVFTDLLRKTKNGIPLKDLYTKDEKIEAISDSFSINDEIRNDGCWNVLIIDDLFDTGVSMEAACKVLKTYQKVGRIYVAALTWK